MNTQERILRASIRLMAQRGFSETSVEQIAAEAGLSGSAPLYYYQSKENIVHGVLDLILANNHRIVSSAVTPEMTALERLRAHFRMNLKWALQFPDEASIELLMYYCASFDDAWSDVYAKMLKVGRQRIRELILAGQREHIFSGEIDIEITSTVLHDALLGGLVAVVGSRRAQARAHVGLTDRWELLFDRLLLL